MARYSLLPKDYGKKEYYIFLSSLESTPNEIWYCLSVNKDRRTQELTARSTHTIYTLL